MSDTQARVTAAVEAFGRGEIVVVTDDDDRENEGDLVMAAVHATPEKMAFIIRNTAGIVCTPVTERARAPAAPRADGGGERRAARHRLHGLGRLQARHHHRHLGRRSRRDRAQSRQQQCGRRRLRAPRPCVSADRQGRRRADALRAYRGRDRPLPARQPRAGRRDLRARQRRRHRDARAADQGLRREAQVQADLGRRADRLPAGAREAGRARRRVLGRDLDRHAQGLCLRDAVRQGASHGAGARRASATARTCRRGCIAPTSSPTCSAAGKA